MRTFAAFSSSSAAGLFRGLCGGGPAAGRFPAEGQEAVAERVASGKIMVVEKGSDKKHRQGQTDENGEEQNVHERVRMGEAGMMMFSASFVSRGDAPRICGTSAQIFGFASGRSGNSLLVQEGGVGLYFGHGHFFL